MMRSTTSLTKSRCRGGGEEVEEELLALWCCSDRRAKQLWLRREMRSGMRYSGDLGSRKPLTLMEMMKKPMRALGEDQLVIARVVLIFTDVSISPSLSPRQCPDRYAFRAGRNLPDKEFRYLRTIIVTAAVHRGFGRRLPCHQSPGPGHCDPLCEGAPLLPKLLGYFAEFLRESCLAPLGILYLPTCVNFGYRYPFVEGRSSFSWEYGMGYFSAVAPGTRALARGIFSTPSYPEKSGAPRVLEPITIFWLT
ncbi:hypothetical protein L3X38_006799 [Prunus dulcis]|uniref:Uncharacterized protein n=1 Tax=Prunus dulcis TaxID=3755 RepID=A0AAD4ZTB6_PRUDU|nr:hypothetical protein L3X38_006799 [Prunus dulcis]